MKKNIVTGMVTVGVIAVMGGISLHQAECMKSDPLLKTRAATAKYTAMLGDESSSNNLVNLSKEQILSKNQTVIKGVVTGIQNIVISNGKDLEYRAIATIQAEKEVRVLLPCASGDGTNVEDTSVVSKMKEGMQGSFLLHRYEGGEYAEDVDGSRLYLQQLTEYEMMD